MMLPLGVVLDLVERETERRGLKRRDDLWQQE